MLINFVEKHRQYLIAQEQEDGCWAYTPVNPDNGNAGIYLSNHQIFSNAALGLGVYLRNEMNSGAAVKVHAGLKLLFSRAVNGRFALHNDPGHISITLDIGGVIPFYQWLSGDTATLRYEEPRRSREHYRMLTGFQAGQTFEMTLRASLTDGTTGDMRTIEVGLSSADIFHLQAHCVGLAKLLYPTLSDELLTTHLRRRVGALQAAQSAVSAGHPTPTLIDGVTIQAQAENGPRRDPAKCSRAVYGVGMGKWPRRHLPTIEFIQSQSVEQMDTLIKAGNSGDFSGWDSIYNRLTSAPEHIG
ncbi:hypothetical protein [Stutzerimonas nitrititolerans]|jgi:hypothetical protein|uniref:hypothetical protein n=1 Tax=Stutzerimonas nitrititolerans TaxID=2482751 RepID=UPI000596FE6C|nr:hypothetical protein [Stutzerimonas nitrititolerans]KIL03070.1 hypothetical protein QX25_17820 [Stutzerimonas stutzeri]